MSYISINNSLSITIARQAVSDEPWFKRLPLVDRDRLILDFATEIAEAVNEKINHYRDNLGAFDTDPDSRKEKAATHADYLGG